MKCKKCSREITELITMCLSCGSFVGYPNVYLAELPEEREALDARYADAVASAAARASVSALHLFENAAKKSSAVVSMSAQTLASLAANQNSLYSNYQHSVSGEVRRPASSHNDQTRRAVDAKLWGSAANDIRYAALSLDGRGLSSYGDCFVTLKEAYISYRTSVLEVNSFDFLSGVTLLSECPLGFRSNWHDRFKVAVAKCAPEVQSSTSADELPKIMLKAGKSRHDDQFIEVHIHSAFDATAFESVIATNTKRNREQKVALKIAQRYAEREKVSWIND